MKPDTDSVLHRYIDGELGNADRLRVEERMRTDPAFRAEYDALCDLDRSLSDALAVDPDRLERLQASVAAQVHRTPALADLAPARSIWSRERWSIAAGFAMLAVGIYAAASVLKEQPADDDRLLDSYRSKIALLESENARLRRLGRRSIGSLPTARRSAKDRKADAPTVEQAPPRVEAPAAPDAPHPNKGQIFASIRGLLSDFGNSRQWDRTRALELLRQLSQADFSDDDFLEMESLFRQQAPGTMGQLFIAQAMRNFVHLPEARRFVHDQAELALRDLRTTGGAGDRMLRRAWTDSLSALGDSKSIGYLEEMGRLDRDWGNRRNVVGALASVGNTESLVALLRITQNEKNPILQQEGMYYVGDMLWTDPSLLNGIESSQLIDPLTNIVRGEFGESGQYWEAMVLALEILSKLSFNGFDQLMQEWQQRNLSEAGGDPARGGNPLGLPIGR